MSVFRILFPPEHDRAPETVEADRVDVEGERWVVFRRVVLVIGLPRAIVVRRQPAASVADVIEVR